MALLRPDLTGLDPTHKVLGKQTTVFGTTPLTVNLDATIFVKSLVLAQVGTSNRPLVKGVDFDILDSDLDKTSMAEMKTYNPAFALDLCKSITFYPKGADYRVSMNYQRLYPNQIKTAYLHGLPLDTNPELIMAIIRQLEENEAALATVANSAGTTETGIRIFEEDPHMENPDNYVENEIHAMNTTSGKVFIHPVGGAFFEEGVVISLKDSTTPLIKDMDYRIFGLDIAKTDLTSRTFPVYNFIVFTTAIVGDVKLSYHAFGGDPTVGNIREIRTQLLNIVAYLNNAKFLTDSTVGDTQVVHSLTSRIDTLEATMRSLLQTGKPSYGDATDGAVRIKKISSPDTQLHWWNIASLYKVDGSEDVTVADRMRLRFRTLYSDLMFDAIISANLTSPEGYRFEVDIESAKYPRGYIPLKDYSGINNLIRPQFRLIWNTNASELSGAILQLGMELKQMTTETVVIEDFSGKECCWKLDGQHDPAVLPQDDLITLPNPHHIWDLSNANSAVESILLPFKQGHLVWAGAKALNRPDGWAHFPITNHLLNNLTDFRRIKKVRLELAEQGGYPFPVDINFIPGLEELNGFAAFNYSHKPANIHMRIFRDTDLQYTEDEGIIFDLNYHVEAGVEATQLDLRGVVIYT